MYPYVRKILYFNLYLSLFLQTLVWKAFAKLQGKWFEDVPVVFKNLRFLKPTVLNTEGPLLTIYRLDLSICAKKSRLKCALPALSRISKMFFF